MSILNRNQSRRLIPRWRSFKKTQKLSELRHHAISPNFPDDYEPNFLRLVEAWKKDNTIDNAAELLNYGFIINQLKAVDSATRFILKNRKNVTEPVYALAKTIIDGDIANNILPSTKMGESLEYLQITTGKEINRVKKELAEWPRHSLLWSDLSRLYAIVGEEKKSKKAMRLAVNLAGRNRFIVRSAARLFIHFREEEHALNLIHNYDNYKNDPWLLATELSINTILTKSSKHIKGARAIIKRKLFSSDHLSELAGALGTVEIASGSIKAAKKYFDESLISPNDNSLAQAEWARSKVKIIGIEDKLSMPCSFEANARHAMWSGAWEKARTSCYEWVNDEPFSSGPFGSGSFLEASIFEDYNKAINFCDLGLIANPEDKDLLNNKAFSLIRMGNTDAGVKVFNKIGKVSVKERIYISLVATAGLIAYREGNYDRGRQLYLEAIGIADKQGDPATKAMASIYLAREEIHCDTDRKDEAVKRAEDYTKDNEDKVVDKLKDILMQEFNTSNQ